MDDADELTAEEEFSAFDRSYWLCRCEGFRVTTRDGRSVGLVEELRFSAPDHLDTLAVRSASGGTLALVAPDQVEEIRPHDGQLVLAARSPSRDQEA